MAPLKVTGLKTFNKMVVRSILMCGLSCVMVETTFIALRYSVNNRTLPRRLPSSYVKSSQQLVVNGSDARAAIKRVLM